MDKTGHNVRVDPCQTKDFVQTALVFALKKVTKTRATMGQMDKQNIQMSQKGSEKSDHNSVNNSIIKKNEFHHPKMTKQIKVTIRKNIFFFIFLDIFWTF